MDYFICQAEFLGAAGKDDEAQAGCGGAMPGKEAVKEWRCELPLRLLFDEKCRLSFYRHLRQLIVVSAAFAGFIRIKFEIH